MQTRIALVTGGSRGIGAAISLALAKDGFDLWVNYRSRREDAESVAARVMEMGRECTLLPFDVTDADAVKEALQPLLENETPFALVNNAGFSRDAVFAMMTAEQWTETLDVHLRGFFNVTQPILFNMLRNRAGRIVNIVSTSGQTGLPGQVNYAAAKAGLIGATKALAAEVARKNILVNAVSPGFIETEMLQEIPRERILPMIPLGRIGKPEEVAGMVSFLCGEGGTFITGQVIGINGGSYM